MLETIRSIKDERIILARAVKTRKGRDEHHRILLEGEQILDWALEHGFEIDYVLVTDACPSDTVEKYLPVSKLFKVSDGIQKKVTGTRYVVPLVGVGKHPARPAADTPGFVVVLDDVKDRGNIGTIVRTCHAFGVGSIIGTTPDLDLYQRKTIEASRGTVFASRATHCRDSSDAIRRLREDGYQIVATSPRGTSLQSLIELEQRPVALVVGNESTGVSQEFEKEADLLIQIPMSLAVESLNVGVATGISVYELRLKQVICMIEQQIRSTLGRELNVAGMLVQKALDAELRKVSNLSSQQVVFMMVLECDQEMSVENMCRQFGVLDTEVPAFMNALTESELVAWDGNLLRMTAKGKEVLAKLWFTVESAESKILSGFAPEEAAALKAQLGKIQANCIQMMDSG